MSKIPKILEDMYLKNLAFFKKQNPQIHSVISNTTPDHSKIIISDEGKIDIHYNGRTIYGGDAIEYVEKEVAEFNKIYEPEKRVCAFSAMMPGLYNSPRFFHSHLNETITQLYQSDVKIIRNLIHTGNRHDFLIMMGIGLGLQVSELLDRADVQNLLILETDHELLSLSCFFTDWEDIYEKQSPKKNKSITLLLMNKEILDNEQTSLWNELIKRAPQFPYNTVFYNHGRHDKYGEIIRKITEDIKMFISLWGFYDDETNQLNHILHNIEQKIKLIPEKNNFMWKKPVIVCGSGPSLDERINQLKSIRDECILITAGSSIDAIINYGLIPDYHIEIESDYMVYSMLKNVGEDITKQITLICAIQCSPLLKILFKDTYAFIKDSLSVGGIIEQDQNKLKEPTPTCVNAALSFALHYNASDIYLFGTDFGFYNEENHHSKASIYHTIDDNQTDEVKEVQEITQNMMAVNFEQPGYKGTCLTTGTFYTTKRRIDMLLSFYIKSQKFNIFTCSDGLIIKHTTHIKQDDVIEIKKSTDTMNHLEEFSKKSRNTSESVKNKITSGVHKPIKEMCDLFINHIKHTDDDIEIFSATCWSLSNYVNSTFQNKHGTLMYFIRGTIWHYTLSGYSIAYAAEPKDQSVIINIWKNRFINFLELLPTDLLTTIEKDRSSIDEDIQLRKTIRE